MDVEAYARQLKQLLPRGALWERSSESDTWLSKTLTAIAGEFARLHTRALTLIEELDPRTTLELLEDWERILGLPDECLSEIPDSIAERQAAVIQKLVSRGGQSRQYYIDLAATLKYTITIDEFTPLSARTFEAGSLAYGDAWAYAWLVHLPVSSPFGSAVFVAGSHAGERLVGYQQLDIECIINRAAPAHTIVLFEYDA